MIGRSIVMWLQDEQLSMLNSWCNLRFTKYYAGVRVNHDSQIITSSLSLIRQGLCSIILSQMVLQRSLHHPITMNSPKQTERAYNPQPTSTAKSIWTISIRPKSSVQQKSQSKQKPLVAFPQPCCRQWQHGLLWELLKKWTPWWDKIWWK